MKICCCFLLLCIVTTYARLLPRPNQKSQHIIKYSELGPDGEIVSLASPKQYDDSFDNSPLAKKRSLVPLLIKKRKFRKPKILVMDDRKESGYDNSPRNLDNYALLDQLFDENGVIYITPRKNDEDRKINKLMNKVVKYKLEMNEGNSLLRNQPLTTMFDSEEIERIDKIAEAIKEDETTPRMTYDFSELVL